jgi:hypothetical protein
MNIYPSNSLHFNTARNVRLALIICFSLLGIKDHAQSITGVWKGKIKSAKIELKLVKKGDSLVGTSYYYESKNNYRRYAIKGYFDDETNNVVWWDDVLIEDKSPHAPSKDAMMAVADFNCPGEGIMKLDGNSSLRDNKDAIRIPLNLQKGGSPVFEDEWDFVLDNYTSGANSPEIIDSIALLSVPTPAIPDGYEAAPLATTVIRQPVSGGPKTPEVQAPAIRQEIKTEPSTPLTVEEKFKSRTKILQTVIPVTGDSIELRFYDNAEIDGDSIAVFLNGRMLRQHILLTDRPYTLKIALTELEGDNELVMVAENLGTIPPNTSLMVAIVGDKRYEARLQSTEGSSALVRFVKEIGRK